MGVVAAGTGKGPFWSARVFDTLDRMAAYWMAFDQALKVSMAAHAEFVNRFEKLKSVLCGMGAVAGNTAATL